MINIKKVNYSLSCIHFFIKGVKGLSISSLLICILIGFNDLKAQLPDTIFIPSVAIESDLPSNEVMNRLEEYALEDPNYQNLGEALATNAHLFAKSYGIGSMTTVSMRGSGAAHTKLLWNGIDLNASTTGVADVSLYPTLFTDGVDVLYGSNSLGLCAGAIGGAIHMRNELRFNQKQALEIKQQVGSFQNRTSQLKYAFGDLKWQSETRIYYREAENNFEYRNIGEAGFPMERMENARLEQSGFMQTIAHRLNEQTMLSARLWYFNSDRELPPIFTLDNINERQEDESFRLMVSARKYFDNSKLSFTQAWLQSSLIYQHDRLDQPSVAEMQSHKSVLQYNRDGSNSKLNLRLNVDLDQALHQSLQRKINRQSLSPFAEWEKQLSDRWKVFLINRIEWILDEDVFVLPSAALEYKIIPNGNWVAFSKIARNVKYPSINDLYWEFGGNEQLVEELSESFDLGFRREVKVAGGINIQLKSNLYYANIDNFIQWVPTQFGYWEANNVRKVEMHGVENQIKVLLNKEQSQWRFFFNHTWSRSINKTRRHSKDESYQQQLIYIPENQVNSRITWLFKNFEFAYTWQFVSERYILSDNSDWLRHYHLSNLSISKKWDLNERQLMASFSVLNLLNADYQTIANRPMPFRNYQITLTFNYNK